MHSAQSNEKICNHIEKYIGVIDNVFKEIISGVLSIDILILDPTPERNFYTLITSGMSELPMTVPEGAEEYQYAEIMICLLLPGSCRMRRLRMNGIIGRFGP